MTVTIDATATADEKNYSMALHLSGLFVLVTGLGFLGPLIMWLIKKDDSEFINEQGKAAVNFHLSTLIWILVCVVLIISIIGALFGILGLVVIGLMQIIMSILAGVRAANGEEARYPLSIRFIS